MKLDNPFESYHLLAWCYDCGAMRPFVIAPGQLCRRRHVHELYGGQGQGGISTPRDFPLVLLFSSPTGEQYGYSDGWDEDGLYRYAGEGQVGDMRLVRGNAAVANHVNQGKDVHLFQQMSPGTVRYVGQMVCFGVEWALGPDRLGHERRIVFFRLAPAGDLATHPDQEDPEDPELARLRAETDIRRLREIALGWSSLGPANAQEQRRVIRRRSEWIRRYALVRAEGHCEACGAPAPFETPKGEPFFEVHYVRRLSDGGPEDPLWVAGICPNCHRQAHFSEDAESFNTSLTTRIHAKERSVSA